MMDYIQNRDKFTKKWRGFAFNEAVKEMDEFISNPIVCIMNYTTNYFSMAKTHFFLIHRNSSQTRMQSQ